MITVHGPNGMKATLLAHSISKAGQKLITWEIEYPRLILAELNTHRVLSRNSFSSRAVPFIKMLEQLNGEPVRFGANQAGMQDKGEDYDALVYYQIPTNTGIMGGMLKPKEAWAKAKELAISIARGFFDAGYHKQVYNRLLEPWQMMKSVVSATEVDNFFWLRDDDAADPTLHALAKIMREAMNNSIPEQLDEGDWHLPYLDWKRDVNGKQIFYIKVELADGSLDYQTVTLDEAIKISCARCAAVSYRNEGYGLEKSLQIYENLVGGDRKHASAFEHCATPIKAMNRERALNVPTWFDTWEPGVSHVTRDGKLWSGNFKGWVQYRKLIAGECYTAE